jgi:hypothetical protein
VWEAFSHNRLGFSSSTAQRLDIKRQSKPARMVVNMSSGKFKSHHGFNKTQIKDGWIVRLRKDGTIKAKLEPYPRVKKNG